MPKLPPPATAAGPEKVRVLARIDGEHLARRAHHFAGDELVGGDARRAHGEADAAAEEEARRPDARAAAMGDGGAGALERGVEVAVPCAAAEPHDAGRGIDCNVVYRRYVDHQSPRGRVAGIGVAAGAGDDRARRSGAPTGSPGARPRRRGSARCRRAGSWRSGDCSSAPPRRSRARRPQHRTLQAPRQILPGSGTEARRLGRRGAEPPAEGGDTGEGTGTAEKAAAIDAPVEDPCDAHDDASRVMPAASPHGEVKRRHRSRFPTILRRIGKEGEAPAEAPAPGWAGSPPPDRPDEALRAGPRKAAMRGSLARFPAAAITPWRRRRGGRAVEGARLESVYTGNRIVGSNPTLSAILGVYRVDAEAFSEMGNPYTPTFALTTSVASGLKSPCPHP